MSGLSSRVMNMKFMQKADASDTQKKDEENQKKIKDLSEWVSPYSDSMIAKARKANNIEAVGYGSISTFGDNLDDDDDQDNDFYETQPSARRTWGAPKKPELDELKVTKPTTKEVETPEDTSLVLSKALRPENGSTRKNSFKLKNKSNNKPQEEPIETGGSLDELWKSLSGKKNSSAAEKPQNKRPTEDEYVPKIDKRRKRFN